MRIFKDQLQGAYKFLTGFQNEEDVKEVRFLKPSENTTVDVLDAKQSQDLLAVEITYRSTGMDAAPLLRKTVIIFGPRGKHQKAQLVFSGNAYYGFLGTLTPININTATIL